MSEERTFDTMLDNATPNGFCPKCRQAMMTINGKPGCPNCSTKTNSKSGLVNMASDPGEAALSRTVVEPDYSHLANNGQAVQVVAEVKTEVKMKDYVGALDAVYDYLGTINVDSVPRFKGLLKLKKKVEMLKMDIKMFLEGGN